MTQKEKQGYPDEPLLDHEK